LRKFAAVCLSLSTATGLTLATPGTASAAPAKCVVGNWKAIAFKVGVTGVVPISMDGFVGAQLKIDKAGTLVYNFSGASPLSQLGNVQGQPVGLELHYSNSVRLKAKISGLTTGTITPRPWTATGNGTSRLDTVYPNYSMGDTFSLAEQIRKRAAWIGSYTERYTCTKNRLKLTYLGPSKAAGATAAASWIFTR
jgi:hypothetical protein